MAFTLPKLPYSFTALEPSIDARTMEIHYSKHHATYTDKLNAALNNQPKLAKQPIEKLLAEIKKLPKDIQMAVRNHGGGYHNHNLFWTSLSPIKNGDKKDQKPSHALASALTDSFGDYETFRQQFEQAALGLFGSGWAWLVINAKQKLAIMTTPNQDSPLSQKAMPLLGLDVWEHAYYLKYQNRRPEYVAAWWKIVNWQEVGKRFSQAV